MSAATAFSDVLSQLVTPALINRVRNEFMKVATRSGNADLSLEEFVSVFLPCLNASSSEEKGSALPSLALSAIGVLLSPAR